MTRLYFDCVIKAAYMAEYHGIKFEAIDYNNGFCEPVDTEQLLDFDYHLACGRYPEKNKIYVAKESEHIFEPKQGDEGRCVGRVGAYYFNYNGQDWAGHSSNASDKPIIIMRDNKHFFNPLIENND